MHFWLNDFSCYNSYKPILNQGSSAPNKGILNSFAFQVWNPLRHKPAFNLIIFCAKKLNYMTKQCNSSSSVFWLCLADWKVEGIGWALFQEMAVVPTHSFITFCMHSPFLSPSCDFCLFAFPSAQRQRLHYSSGRSYQDIQLPPATGINVWPHSHNPGHPTDRAWPPASAGRAVLSAHQTDKQGATSWQHRQPVQLADPDMRELHLPAQQGDP